MSEFDFESFMASFSLICEVENEFVWGNEIKVECFQKPLPITVNLYKSIDKVIFSRKQQELIENIVDSCQKYYKFWMNSTVKTIQDDPSYWGFYDEGDGFYEQILSIDSIEKLIENVSEPNVCLLPDKDNQLVYGFGFDQAEFHFEYGYGVLFVGEKVLEAGPYVPLIADYRP